MASRSTTDNRVHRDFLDQDVISKLSGLPLDARLPMLGNVSGRHRSPIRGSSLEFAEYRKYVQGDDTRRLDWRAYGRSDRFYIKEYEADTNLRLCLIVDTSGSMDFGEAAMSKIDYARRLAGTLAYLASRQGDAVGLYGANSQFTTEIPAKRSGAHLRHLLDSLGSMKAEGTTGLSEVLHEAAERISQRSLIVVFSDLFVEPATLKDCFQHLRYRKHDVAVFHLLEQTEIDFNIDRPVRFVDMEGGAPLLADPTLITRQYYQAMKQYFEEIKGIVRDTNIDYQRVTTEQPYGEVLAKFLLSRARRGRR